MCVYNSERVILLRQIERMTQKRLSEQTGISQATLSKIENRQVEFTKPLAVKMSMAIDYPLTFFEGQSGPLPVTSLTYRHTSSTSVGELNSIAAEYSMLCDVVDNLSARLQLQPKTLWLDEFAVHTKPTDGEIERLAEKTRGKLGIPASGSIGNLTRTLERVGIIIAPIHGLASKLKALLNSDGVTMPSRNKWSMPVIGYSQRDNTGDRLRFTIAHELGHLILHRYRKPIAYRDMEREAHRFAGALLMPQQDAKILLKGYFMLSDLMKLKATWGMSIASIVSRASNLGLIDANRTRSLQIQINSRGWRKQEPVHVGDEHPLLLRQIIQAEYGAGESKREIDSFAAEKGLNVPFRYLDQWSDGLVEAGSGFGFQSRRFKDQR